MITHSHEIELGMDDNRERDLPTKEEIWNAIEKLKNNKAPGTDRTA